MMVIVIHPEQARKRQVEWRTLHDKTLYRREIIEIHQGLLEVRWSLAVSQSSTPVSVPFQYITVSQ